MYKRQNKGLYGYSKEYQYEPECITITARGNVGTAICRSEKFNAIVRLLVLKPKKKISCYFISEFINNNLNFSHVGAAQNQLTAPMIKDEKIIFPNTYNEQLKIALLTTHIPLSKVPESVTRENLKETIKIINENFSSIWKIQNPSIGILGLNPHAGEGGFIGKEEEEIIKPFINSSNDNLFGPISADTAFTRKNIDKYDVFLAMFHDQGLPVIKSFGFGNTLNITLGLPFLRISVDHGTAYEIAENYAADFSSMNEALLSANLLL